MDMIHGFERAIFEECSHETVHLALGSMTVCLDLLFFHSVSNVV